VEKSRTEINSELLRLVRNVAKAQGRPESDIMDDAVASYLDALDYLRELGEASTWPAARAQAELLRSREEDRSRDGFLALLDRMSSRFDLDDPDEAMRIAVEEQHAFRRERAERERAKR
jgi:hypothetical protein